MTDVQTSGSSYGIVKGRTLSLVEISTLTHQPGFTWNGLAIAGIGLAESGGRTNAVHVNTDGSRDRGWLQINDRQHPDVSDACAFNPTCAVHAAYSIWQKAGGAKNDAGYHVWTTYGGDAYKKALRQLLAHGGYTGGVPKLIRNPSLGPDLNPLSWTKALAHFFGLLLQPKTWLRVVEVIAALALGWFALRQLSTVASGGQQPRPRNRVVVVP